MYSRKRISLVSLRGQSYRAFYSVFCEGCIKAVFIFIADFVGEIIVPFALCFVVFDIIDLLREGVKIDSIDINRVFGE